MRKSDRYLLLTGVLAALFTLTVVDVVLRGNAQNPRLSLMSQQVKILDLTDLSLFTEARYTRHLSQADRHTAFQNHPLALEHFPSGSLLLPPQALR